MGLQSNEYEVRIAPLVVAAPYEWQGISEQDEEQLIKMYVQFNWKPRGLINAVADLLRNKNV
jgi:hypothetical protein